MDIQLNMLIGFHINNLLIVVSYL